MSRMWTVRLGASSDGDMDQCLHELIWRAVDPDGEEERG